VTRSRCDHPTHCSKTTRSLTSDNRPSTSDNSKSPQDAAIRYEPAAAVKQHFFKTKPSNDNNDIINKHFNHNLTRLQTSPAPTLNNKRQTTTQPFFCDAVLAEPQTEASPRKTAATLKMTTFEFPACQ